MPYKAEKCTKTDIDELMTFMRDKWSDKQMISRDKPFVDYTFLDNKAQSYNIIYIRNVETNEIAGFIAYVTASFYDNKIKDDFVWLTNWFVTEDAEGGAGILLFMKVRAVTGCKNIGTVGQNKTAEKLYNRMNFITGSLNHYFIVNESADLKIISNYYNKKKEYRRLGGEFKELSISELKAIKQSTRPKKTAEFIVNKYVFSPYYKYYIYGVYNGNDVVGAIVFKVIMQNGSKCLRLVEYYGDTIGLVNKEPEFSRLITKFNAEYIDFYCYGINEDILLSAGFEKKTGNVVVPNYFEPFVNENIDIRFAYYFSDTAGGFTVFKGDGDRDFKRFAE